MANQSNFPALKLIYIYMSYSAGKWIGPQMILNLDCLMRTELSKTCVAGLKMSKTCVAEVHSIKIKKT